MGNFIVWVVWIVAALACLGTGARRRQLHEPVLLGAGADRQPRLARCALPARVGRVRRRSADPRLRRRRDGDVPVRDRLPRRPGRRALGRAAALAAARRRRRRGRAARRGARGAADKASGRLSDEAEVENSFGSPAEIGQLFLTDHLLAFEITSIVLLVAAIGGVVLGMSPSARGDAGLMLGPGVPWYLAVSGVLFAIGAIGVLLRRSPLIVLLSLEIMLNASNLALVGFSRLFGTVDGQVFAIAVMAVAAAEVCVGLGLIVAFARRKLALDVDTLTELRG